MTKHLINRIAPPFVLVLATIGLAACSQDPGTPGETNEENVERTLAEVVADGQGMSSIAAALSDTGLASVFEGPGVYTLLAPNDAAFDTFENGAESLMNEEQRPILVAIIRDHIVPGHLTPESIKEAIRSSGGAVTMRTLGEGRVTFDNTDEGLVVTGPNGAEASISGEAVATSNGVLIPVDGLLEAPAKVQ